MTTRRDIPSRGTGAGPLATYYVVNAATGEAMAVSTPDAVHDNLIKLVAVPPEVTPDAVGDYLANLDLWPAPSVAVVIEFARRPEMYAHRPVHPAVAAALDAAKAARDAAGEGRRG